MGVWGELYINETFVSAFKIVRRVLPVEGTDDWYEYNYEYRVPDEYIQTFEGSVEHKRSNGLEKLTALVMEDVYEQLQTVAP